jgi:HEAT repeat protein
VLERLLREIEKDPSKLGDYLNILPRSERSAEFVKEIYDKSSSGTESDREQRAALKRWLKFHTPYYSSELALEAARVSDLDDYVTNHDALIALARVDWDRAEPIVSRLYNNPGQKASRTAALWAMYVHALESNSTGDIERYRDELKEIVADKMLGDGVRDLALDALSLEKDWNGRDEWYASMMEDETLTDLGRFTGLTTLIANSPEEKYIDRMIALLASDNINVRSAAARNLLLKLEGNRPDVLKALLPWLENPKWLRHDVQGRGTIVQVLGRVKEPESLPGLLVALDEKDARPSYADAATAANVASNAMAAANRVISNSRISSNTSSNISVTVPTETFFPFRYSAIAAMAFQRDGRAVPALRRILSESALPYENQTIVGAIHECGGFSITEQVDALEHTVKDADRAVGMSNTISNVPIRPMITETSDVRQMLGLYISLKADIDDALGRALVDRIGQLDKTDPPTALALRRLIVKWSGPAINALLLRDLKNNRTETDAVVKLLSIRKQLREEQQQDVFDLRTGGPAAVGISSCLIEDPNDLDAILNSPSDETKTAMLACARLIRAPLAVQKVAENLKSHDKLLALAAERYLETEDSPEARRIVLSLHPNEAKILGATTAFSTGPIDSEGSYTPNLLALFGTVSEYYVQARPYFGAYDESSLAETEKRLQQEVKSSPDLLGIYSWEENSIRIYKDRAVLNWEDDPARYRERVLTNEEFDHFKGLLSHYRADELPPFLSCAGGEGCETRELLMLGRNGGRRVFVKSSSLPPLFSELDRLFKDMRLAPSTIKYWAGKDVPSLEVLFASEQLDAMAVWKSGGDFRLLTADKIRRAAIDSEIAAFAENLPEIEEAPAMEYGEDGRISKERSRREYENFTWNIFVDGSLGAETTQPAQVEFIPIKDSFAVPPHAERWKARAGAIEIRANDEGLYKIVAGKLTKIRTGSYSDPVVTPNGRWVVVSKYDESAGNQLVRVNLLTNREVVVPPSADGVDSQHAFAYIASVNRILVGLQESYEGENEYSPGESVESDSGGYSLLDPETGSLIPARGEIRPIVQQTFRALQPTSNPFEFWAALANGEDTVIGQYSSRTFTFKPLLKLSKIRFNSMDMWTDEPAGKVYFVYEGHLLGLQIKVR